METFLINLFGSIGFISFVLLCCKIIDTTSRSYQMSKVKTWVLIVIIILTSPAMCQL